MDPGDPPTRWNPPGRFVLLPEDTRRILAQVPSHLALLVLSLNTASASAPPLVPLSVPVAKALPEAVPIVGVPADEAATDDAATDDAAGTGWVRRVTVSARTPIKSQPERASSVVGQRELEERLPRSAPDALRYEPGVYVQQTAHGQASPYVRGMTGQQTAIFFDGVRINNSTFRQGPNQYFFTIDSRSIRQLEVIRGSSSTRYGSDALGGAFLARPIEPSMSSGARPLIAHGRGLLRTGTADGEIGGRVGLDLSYLGTLGLRAGVGYRELGELTSGGRILSPATGEPQQVPPLFHEDGKTQRGTGFREFTADVRSTWRLSSRTRLTLAGYDYRQFDGPRTDKCPPPTAPEDECLRYPEQFRDLVYARLDFDRGRRLVQKLSWTLSFQEQHERRRLDRGSPSATELHGVDDVRTLGSRIELASVETRLADQAWFRLRGGADAYYDSIASRAWIRYDDVDIVSRLSRGQYLDGAQYLTSGIWTQAETELWRRVTLRVGGRGAMTYARADGDEASESAPVDRHFVSAVGHGGVSVQTNPWLRVVLGADQGFRAPNLDDLTSRQQTGPGFQFENASLEPERTLTLDFGMIVAHAFVEVEGWIFQTVGRDMVARVPVAIGDCPEGDPGCGASQTVFTLGNPDGRSIWRGTEASLRAFLPWNLLLRATVAYAWGEGPDPLATAERVPISRVPPLNGTGEFGWRSAALGFHAVAAVRWAALQDRLALSDRVDPRIPEGGTPGFAVLDLRLGYRWDPHVVVGLNFENLTDAAYRYHGSSINGPGRGVLTHIELGF